MSKDNQIIKSNLSTLLKKFSRTDVISKFDDEYQLGSVVNIEIDKIVYNKFLCDFDVDDNSFNIVFKDIKLHGMTTPIIVRTIENGKYELISGRKRLLSAKKLNYINVACIVKNYNDEDMLLYMLYTYQIEKNKPVVEMGTICNLLCTQYMYTQFSLAKFLGISRSQVTNMIRITQLPKNIQKDITQGKLSYGHARAILGLKQQEMNKVVNLIYDKKLSVRDTEYFVNELKSHQGYDELLFNFEKRNTLKAKIEGKHLILSFKSKKELTKFIIKK